MSARNACVLNSVFCFRCRLELGRDIWHLNGNCQFCHVFQALSHKQKLPKKVPRKKKTHIFISKHHWNCHSGKQSQCNLVLKVTVKCRHILGEQWVVYPDSSAITNSVTSAFHEIPGPCQLWMSRATQQVIFMVNVPFRRALFGLPFLLKSGGWISKVMNSVLCPVWPDTKAKCEVVFTFRDEVFNVFWNPDAKVKLRYPERVANPANAKD